MTGSVLLAGVHDLAEAVPHPHVRFLARVGSPGSGVEDDVHVDASLDRLPYPKAAFDVVVCSFSLCTTARPEAALREIGRVLRPSGRVVFLEHNRSPGLLGDVRQVLGAEASWRGRCRSGTDVQAAVRRAGLVTRAVDWFWPTSLLNEPAVQGVAVHPDFRYERELGWLRGT
ncbi:class I SAM-dependent methyltransferase [Parasphingorhabdus pacifica]